LKKKILVSVDAGETRVAVLEAKGSARAGRQTKDDEGGGQQKRRFGDDNWRVGELYVERRGSRSIVGNIYKGVVDNVLPGMEAAFVDIGLERNGFLHVDEIVTPDGKAVPKRGRGQGRRIDELIKRGHKKAFILDEGINLWHQKKYPVTAAPGVEPPALEPTPGVQPGHEGHAH